MVEKLLGQYVMEVRVEGTPVRALLQPLTGKLERLAIQDPGPLGLQSRQRYLYIGPVEPELWEGTELVVGDIHCVVQSAHRIAGDNGPAYYWAYCVKKGRVEGWSMSS